MTFGLSTNTSSQIIWWVLIVLGIIVAYVVIRFFWTHILKYLFQGCLVILAVIALWALFHYYFKFF